jgi:hypothetical protein
MLDTDFLRKKQWLAILLFVTIPVLPTQSQTREEVVLWESIKDSNRVGDFLAYLDKYPIGTFESLAKRHLAELTTFQILDGTIFLQVGASPPCDAPPPPVQNTFSPADLKGGTVGVRLKYDGMNEFDELSFRIYLANKIEPKDSSETSVMPKGVPKQSCIQYSKDPKLLSSGRYNFKVYLNRI